MSINPQIDENKKAVGTVNSSPISTPGKVQRNNEQQLHRPML